jgi:hypothetical protein
VKLKILISTLALMLFASACSQPMSPQEYFTQLSDINKQMKDAEQKASEEMQGSLTSTTSETAAVDAFNAYLSTLATAAQDAMTAVDELKPPSELESAHSAFVSAQGDLVDGLEAVRTDLKGAAASEIQGILDQHADEMTALSKKVDDSCQVLQDAADKNDIKVTLCDTSGQDSLAQSSARNAMAAAKTLFVDTDDYSQISAAALAQLESSLTWVDSPAPSTDANTVSVWSDGEMVFAEAVLSQSGTCFWMRDDATAETTYGTGSADTCTGEDAAGATASQW